MLWISLICLLGLLGYMVWCCRETRLVSSLSLASDGVALIPDCAPDKQSDQERVLSSLPAGYQFLDYRYSITGCSLSTFHRDVTSSGYEFQTRHPVYTLICYGSEGSQLAVVPGSHSTVPFVWRAPCVIQATEPTAVLFDCDILHAGVISRDNERIAVQYKIAHADDIPRLAELQGIDVDKTESNSVPLVYEWLSRKLSLLFPFLINHVFTRYLQRQDSSLLNRVLLAVFGRSFYNR